MLSRNDRFGERLVFVLYTFGFVVSLPFLPLHGVASFILRKLYSSFFAFFWPVTFSVVCALGLFTN